MRIITERGISERKDTAVESAYLSAFNDAESRLGAIRCLLNEGSWHKNFGSEMPNQRHVRALEEVNRRLEAVSAYLRGTEK